MKVMISVRMKIEGIQVMCAYRKRKGSEKHDGYTKAANNTACKRNTDEEVITLGRVNKGECSKTDTGDNREGSGNTEVEDAMEESDEAGEDDNTQGGDYTKRKVAKKEEDYTDGNSRERGSHTGQHGGRYQH